MLKATEAFRNKVLNSPSFLEWKYVVKNGGREYDGEIIKNLTISGQLQNQFTIGSSLSKSLELELLVSEETDVDPIIMVEASLVLGRTQTETPEGTVINTEYSDSVVVGYFHVTEVDRGTYGKLKIYAIDMMGHPDYLSNSVVDFSIFNDIETDVGIIVDAIAGVCGLSTNIADEYRAIRISNFFTALTALTYKQTIEDTETDRPSITHRQLLEYVAGFCGCNVRINSFKNDEGNIVNEIEFFKFKDTDITLTADNYYSMTKGIHEFRPTGIVCTGLNDKSILVGGTGKDSETIKMTNPFIDTKDLLVPISRDYCEDGYSENRVSYYPITAELVGTCLFEPGDIVTIEEVFRDSQTGLPIKTELRKVYIQDYKLTFNNGVKETIQSFFEYNKGSIANSISGKISQLNTDLENTKTYISDHYVSNTDFKITIEDISTNVAYANDGLNKWTVEFYELSSRIDSGVYDMDSVIGLEYRRRELIEDAERLVAKNIYDGVTVCRYRTGVYVVPEGGGLFKTVDAVTTVGAYVYINGEPAIRTGGEVEEGKKYGELSNPYSVTFKSGWNIVEIYVGYERDGINNDTAIDTLFWLKFYDNEVIYPFYNISATYTQEEKEEENNTRTIVLNYRDPSNVLLKRVHEEILELGTEYDFSSLVDPDYLRINDVTYFFGEIVGEIKGIVRETTFIDVIYFTSDYFRSSVEYVDEQSETLKLFKNKYLRKSEYKDGYPVYLHRELDGYINKQTDITRTVFTNEFTTDTLIIDPNQYVIDAIPCQLDNLVYIDERVYFKAKPDKINIRFQFSLYKPSKLLKEYTYTESYDYNNTFKFTVNAPAGYSIIGYKRNSENIRHLYSGHRYLTVSRTLKDDDSNYTFYVIRDDQFMLYFKFIEGPELSEFVSGIDVNVYNKPASAKYNKTAIGIYSNDAIGYDSHIFDWLNKDKEVKDVTLFYGGQIIKIDSYTDKYIDPLIYDIIAEVRYEEPVETYNLSPSLDEPMVVDESGDSEENPDGDEYKPEEDNNTNDNENSKKIYKRFPYITLINPYVIDINYTYVKEVERLTTADSIIDKITEKKYMDDAGNEYNGADYLYKQSSVVQTIDNIEQRIEVEEKTSEEMKEQMSSVNQTVDGFKLTFETALFGNYLSNSAFSTDDPLTGFNYTTPTNIYRNVWYDIFTYRLDNPSIVDDENGDYHKFYYFNDYFDELTYEGKCNINDNSKVVDKEDIENYAYLSSYHKTSKDNTIYSFKGVEPNDSENSYSSSNRTLSMGNTFKLSQSFSKDDENFPFFKDTDTGEYYQLYIAIKAKRTENCIRKLDTYYSNKTAVLDKNTHVFPKMKLSVTFNYDYEEIIDGVPYVNTTNLTINNIDGQPSTDEGKLAYGKEVDLDNLKRLEGYEIDTEWKLIEYFVNLPEEIFDNMLSLNTITVTYEIEYGFSISKSYMYKSNFYTEYHDFSVHDGIVLRDENIVVRTGLSYTRIYDVEPIDGEMTEEDSIFICEPMFGTTKNYSRLPFTTKKAELITGVTNITQDGIQVSRSNSKIATEIRNGGMTITHDGETVASFQEKTIIPELDVTKKLIAPNIFINDYERYIDYNIIKEEILDENGNVIDYNYIEEKIVGNDIPEEIIIDPLYTGEDLGYWEGYDGVTKIAPVFNYFNEVQFALQHYGVIQLDKLVIRIKKHVGGVYPWGIGGGMSGAFYLENLRCGIIDIILEEDVELAYPIVLKNIEGTVRIRGPREEHEIVLDDYYINGYRDEETGEQVGRAPIVTNIIAHNVRWLEIFGLNFSGGRDYPPFNEPFHSNSSCNYDPEKGGWVTDIFPDMVFQTSGEYLTYEFHEGQFPLCDLYNNGTLEELNYILNDTAIFIGYCNLVDISYCNFPTVFKKNFYVNGTVKYDLGVLGDHSDCYLSHNKGTFGSEYYRNRDKCWFRIPPEGLEEGIPSLQPVTPERDQTTSNDLMGGIFPGGMIRKAGNGGTAIDHCYLGKSKDLAYLGSLQYTSGTDQSSIHPYIMRSNTSNYSRIRKSAKQKPLEALYTSTDGYFFGSFESIPGVSYSPNDTSVASYTQHTELKLTSLMNGLGVSIELPSLKEFMKEKTLLGARLELEFENAFSKESEYNTLAEYGSTTAMGIIEPYTTEGMSARGGGFTGLTYNAGVSFGVRFVYDSDAHYDGDSLRMGYYNMGKSTRAHEILDPGDPTDVTRPNSKAINTWAIDDEGNYIHNIKNFSYMEGARPYYVGTPLVVDGQYGEPVYALNIDLGVITEKVEDGWFTQEFMDSYTENFSNTSSGVVSPTNFFNSLNGIASGAIKYIDLVPVGVRTEGLTDKDGNPLFPGLKRYANFSYDCTGDNEATTALATSCFKITKAKLVLDTHNNAPIPPDSFTLTVNYEDENGNTIKPSERATAQGGTTIYLGYYMYGRIEGDNCTYHYSHCKEGDITSVYLDKNKEVTLVYLPREVEYRILISYGIIEDSGQNNVYDNWFGHTELYVKKGETYDVSDYVKNPNKYGIEVDEYIYEFVRTDGHPVTGIADGAKHIYVRYREYIGTLYTITINFLRGQHEIVDGEYIETDGYEEELFERRKIKPTITRQIKHGAKYDLVPYIDNNQLIISDCIVDDFDGLEYEYRSYGVNNVYDYISGRATGNIKLDINYKLPYEVEYGAHAPYATYTGNLADDDDLSNYINRSVSMGENGQAYVGILSRTNQNTLDETYYYRFDNNYHDYVDSQGIYYYGHINQFVYRESENRIIAGNQSNGVEYLFNTKQMQNNFSNANDIYLNIKFSKKSYAHYYLPLGGYNEFDKEVEYAGNDDLHYYIVLEISKTRKIQNLSTHDSGAALTGDRLHYGLSRIQLDNKYDKPTILSCTYEGSDILNGITRHDEYNNVAPFIIEGCSPESTEVYTQKIKLNSLVFSKEWYERLEDMYYSSDLNRADSIHPDIFTDINELVRRGMLVGVKILPTNRDIFITEEIIDEETGEQARDDEGNLLFQTISKGPYVDGYSDQCLKILDIWLSDN